MIGFDTLGNYRLKIRTIMEVSGNEDYDTDLRLIFKETILNEQTMDGQGLSHIEYHPVDIRLVLMSTSECGADAILYVVRTVDDPDKMNIEMIPDDFVALADIRKALKILHLDSDITGISVSEDVAGFFEGETGNIRYGIFRTMEIIETCPERFI